MMRYLLYIVIVQGTVGCNLFFKDPPADINDPRLVNQAWQRLDRYKNTKIENCQEEILEEAEIYVDSLVAEQIDAFLAEQELFPTVPNRPKPHQKINIDSFFNPVPLNQDSIPTNNKDTILRQFY